MKLKIIFVLFSAIISYGCSTHPAMTSASYGQFWRDDAFEKTNHHHVESKASLFALDSTLESALIERRRNSLTVNQRLDYLISTLFTQGKIRIAYTAGHSTNAAETWATKRGDCLSLTLMTYAAARTLGLDAYMQEVRVPVAVDRRNGTDFVSGHVNVVVYNASAITINGRGLPNGNTVIDFEPQIGSRQTGNVLSDDQIVARFYNNRGSELFAVKDDPGAYAYFKAAIEADPAFAPAYSNLALLYTRNELYDAAEALLRHAIALADKPDAPLRALQNLLLTQDRKVEAQEVAERLHRFDYEDPYFWVNTGLDHLQKNQYSKAIQAFQRAEELATGFEEIHRYLAIAYWHDGQQKQADKQLAILAGMHTNDRSIAKLSAKLNQSPNQFSVQ
jgi:tetratricopeptide (TPR) repeat protein